MRNKNTWDFQSVMVFLFLVFNTLAMKNFINVFVMAGLLLAGPVAGQKKIPLVYGVENSGAKYAAPTMPELNNLPVIKTLPDPFA